MRVPVSISHVIGSTVWVPVSTSHVKGSGVEMPVSTSHVKGSGVQVPVSPSHVKGSGVWVPVKDSSVWVPVLTPASVAPPSWRRSTRSLGTGSLGSARERPSAPGCGSAPRQSSSGTRPASCSEPAPLAAVAVSDTNIQHISWERKRNLLQIFFTQPL